MEKHESRTLVLNEVHRAMQLQKERRVNMETKAGILLGFTGGILALMMSGYSVFNSLALASRLLIIGSIASFFTAVVNLLFVTRTRRLRVDPHPRAFAEKYRLKPSEETIDQLLSTLIDAFEENEPTIEEIAIALRRAYLSTSIGLTALSLGLISSLFVL